MRRNPWVLFGLLAFLGLLSGIYCDSLASGQVAQSPLPEPTVTKYVEPMPVFGPGTNGVDVPVLPSRVPGPSVTVTYREFLKKGLSASMSPAPYAAEARNLGHGVLNGIVTSLNKYRNGLFNFPSPDRQFPFLGFNSIDKGIIAGFVETNDGSCQGVVYNGEQFTLIPGTEEFPNIFFNYIKHNIAVGEASSSDFSSFRGAIYAEGKLTLVSGPEDFPNLTFYGVSDGKFVGVAYDDNYNLRGAFYENGTLSLMEGTSEFPNLQFIGIEKGVVVGQAADPDQTASKGLIYQNGLLSLIPAPAELPILAFVKIDNGVAVGVAMNAAATICKGVIYQHGRLSVVEGSSAYPNLTFTGISNGVIVGSVWDVNMNNSRGVIYKNKKLSIIETTNVLHLLDVEGSVAVGYSYHDAVADGIIAICR